MTLNPHAPIAGAAESNTGAEWVATVAALQVRVPALGSIANINRLLVMKDGLPHRRLGRRLLFNIPEVSSWLGSLPKAG